MNGYMSRLRSGTMTTNDYMRRGRGATTIASRSRSGGGSGADHR
jgi:hypothetical protein